MIRWRIIFITEKIKLLKNKVLLYFGIVLCTTTITLLLGAPNYFLSAYIIPIIYIIFQGVNLYQKSKTQAQFTYWKGFLTCFAFGTYGTIIYISFSALCYLLLGNRSWDSPTTELRFHTLDIFVEIAFIMGSIYTLISSVILPFFFIKNKNLNQDIILDDDNF